MEQRRPQVATSVDGESPRGTLERWRGQLTADRVVRALSAAAVVLVLGVCGYLAILQLLERGRFMAEHDPDTEAATVEAPAEERDPAERESLFKVLPVSVDGFRTSARHDVPGFEGTMAEAIFTPLAEEVSIRMPLNCYVVVRSPEGTVAEEFARVAARYPERSEPAGVAGIDTEQSFVSHDRSTYVIGWVASDYVVLVDTRFTMATPVDADDVLELHATAVARAVAERIGR